MEELLKVFGNLSVVANQRITLEIDANGKMTVRHDFIDNKAPQQNQSVPAANLKTKAQIKQEIDVLVARKQLAEQNLFKSKQNQQAAESQLEQYQNMCDQLEAYLEQEDNTRLSLEEEICFLSDELQKAMNQRSVA